MRDTTRKITSIVIHCSATPNGQRVTAADIDGWHAKRGFARDPALIGYNQPDLKAIGYHYVVHANGAVEIGRGENEYGAHAYGHNRQSLGVCMVGLDKYSTAQWQALASLVRGVRERIPTISRVVGHRDLSPDIDGDGLVEKWEWLKTCPGFDVNSWLAGGMNPLAGHLWSNPA